MIQCVKCGHQNSGGKFCIICGAAVLIPMPESRKRIVPAENRIIERRTQTSRSAIHYGIISALFVIVILLVYFIWYREALFGRFRDSNFAYYADGAAGLEISLHKARGKYSMKLIEWVDVPEDRRVSDFSFNSETGELAFTTQLSWNYANDSLIYRGRITSSGIAGRGVYYRKGELQGEAQLDFTTISE